MEIILKFLKSSMVIIKWDFNIFIILIVIFFNKFLLMLFVFYKLYVFRFICENCDVNYYGYILWFYS